MHLPRTSRKNTITALFFTVAAGLGTVIELLFNIWGPTRVHGSATPPRRKRR